MMPLVILGHSPACLRGLPSGVLMDVTRWAISFLFCLASVALAQQSSPPPTENQTQSQEAPHPGLAHRSPPNPGAPEGQIKLDVLVTDAAGRPVAGLDQGDFTLLDNKKPQPILSFRAVDGSRGNGTAAEPPVEVILLIDATNNSLHNIAFERDQIEKFLRQNGGHLAQPVTLMIFSERGVQVGPQPSNDGNLVAQELDKSGATTHTVPRSGGYDAIERLGLSLKTLRSIAAVEAPKPGRKMLIWIGPGWPMLEGPGYRPSDATQRALFNALVETTRTLREARITLYNVNQLDPSSAAFADFYKGFLKGVPSPRQAESGDLSVPVLTIHSGGLVLNTPGDLVSQLNRCVAEAKAYYTLGFDPLKADHTDEYHELEVKVDRPGMKVRTNAGYYAEPAFQP
jgi:VWFA-related protein